MPADPAEGPRGPVLALSGRRIDALDAEVARFPLASVPSVERGLAELMAELRPRALVTSAACGADLLGLEAAAAADVPAVVVLPFDAARFRTTSVEDRPGGWGPRYDRALAQARAEGRLVVLDGDAGDDDDAYDRAGDRLLDEARRLAGQGPGRVVAVAVWDGRSRGEGDLTARFVGRARERGLPVMEVSTVEAPG